ncbi:MAG: protoporphyrinogen oxidase [Acidobacteriaceae bacterium]
MRHTIIIGGGITGLAAAYSLQKTSKGTFAVTLIEGTQRLGGKITTARSGGFLVEGGPDSFLARKTVTLELCRELGLEDQLQPARAGKYPTFVWSGGRLHPLPMGVKPMVDSRLISLGGKLRLAAEVLVPPREMEGDESVASFMRRRFGSEMLEKLAGPLMGGIYAADPERLSLDSTFPFLQVMEKKYGSVLRGWKKARGGSQGKGKAQGGRSMFLTLRGGLLQLAEALETAIGPGVVERGVQVAAVLPKQGRYEVVLEDGRSLTADDVVFATPAHVTAGLVEYIDTALAERLRSIRYVTTATVSLGFREQDVPRALDGFGFVVPRMEQRRINACTWTSTKFEGRAPDGHVLMRVFVGGAGAEAYAERTDDALIALARQEVDAAMNVGAEPVLAQVYRWPKGNPQYEVGHRGRVEEIEALAATHRGLYLAGAAYHGAGIPDCIENAQAVVRQLVGKYGISQPAATGRAVTAAAR